MIHLFHIHSNTCYISAVGIIEKESIAIDKVIFLLCRNLPEIRSDIKHFRMDDELYYFPYLRNNQLFNFKFISSKKRLTQVDKLLDESVKGKFIYYVHNSRNYLYCVIISKSNCHEVRFMEDGLDMYFDEKAFDRKYPQKVWLRHKLINFLLGKFLGVYNRLFQSNNPFANKNTEIQRIYGLTNESFQKFIDPKYEYKVLDRNVIRSIQNYKLDEGSHLFVFSALVEQHVAKHTHVDALIDWFADKFAVNKLHVNFHPHQSSETRSRIISRLESLNVEVEVVPDEIIMEVLFINNEKLHIYGTGTSLLMYSAYFSPSSFTYCLYPFFEKQLNFVTIRTRFWDNSLGKVCKDNFKLYGRDFE